MNIYEQINSVFYDELKRLTKQHPRSYFNLLRTSKFSYLHDWIENCVPQLSNSKYKLSTKCNWIINGIEEFPTCTLCGLTFGESTNLQINSKYSSFCPRCARKKAAESTKATVKKKMEEDIHYYDNIVQQRKATNCRLHNDPNWNNMEKNRSTCIDRYGTDNVRKTPQCKAAIKQTKKDRYGNENYNNTDKFKQTCLNNNGVEWPMQSAYIRAKSASKYKYDSFEFDSKQELCFYIWLRDNNIKFEVNQDFALSYMHDGKNHKYIPDFIVDGQIVEIKGDHFFKEDGTMCNPYDHSQDALYEAKHQCMIANNVKIILQSECNEYMSYVNEIYGIDFVKKCKNK